MTTEVEERKSDYWDESRRLGLSIVFILPLLVIYHIGVFQSGSGLRNSAEVWFFGPLSLVTADQAQALNIGLAIVLLVAVWKVEHARAGALALVPLMLAESVLYALLMAHGVLIVTEALQRKCEAFLAMNGVQWTGLFLGVGAGVYEELLFRLVVLGGVAVLLHKVFMWNRLMSYSVALVLSALAFSLAHYVGPLAELPDSFTFLFRALCGVALGLIFIARGLGITVWTHAIYNVFLLLA